MVKNKFYEYNFGVTLCIMNSLAMMAHFSVFLVILLSIWTWIIPKKDMAYSFNYNCEELTYADQIDIWPEPRKWSESLIEDGKLKLRHYMLNLNMSDYKNNLYYSIPKPKSLPAIHRKQDIGKKGVVMLVTKDSFKMAYSNIIMMRGFSNISIEIYHYNELTNPQQIVFANMLNINVIDLKELVFISHPINYIKDKRNYQLKSAAMLASQFEDILFLDTDNIPVKDPYLFFDLPEYKQFGLILWPDIWKTNPKNPVFKIFNTTCRNTWEIEAAQILVNKRKHFKSLLLAYHILQDREFWFDVFFGDKDVMTYAATIAGLPFKVAPYFPSLVGYVDRLKGNFLFCGLVMLQRGFDGYPMFFHANQVKYRGNVRKDSLDKIIMYKNGFQNHGLKGLLVDSSLGYGCTSIGERSPFKDTELEVKDTNQILGSFVDNWLELRQDLMAAWD